MSKLKEPKVSVIVPIFNAEPFLHRCVDSLVYQTLDEIEIILVDNQSSDKSWEIMEQYRENFPDKVRTLQLDKHYGGPGAGRNLGLKYANAPYIGFADSDDYFEYNAFELMYNKAVTEECDLVYVASYDVEGQNCKITRTLPTGTREEILTVGSLVFWNKLFSKELFDMAGKIPENMVFEDLAYCPELVSYAKKIGYISTPLYYYIIREDSGVNTLNPGRVLKSIDAENRALEKCNPEYIDVFADSVAMRICNDIRDRWQFADSYIIQLKSISKYLNNNTFFQNDKRNYDRVKVYYNLPDQPMPQIIYVNGFEGVDQEFLDTVYKKSFWEYTNVVIVNYDKCDWSDEVVCKLYSDKSYDLLSKYIAMKLIYANGGIYLSNCIEIENTLNYLRFFRLFFSYLDNDNFSDDIFGGMAGNEILGKMIEKFKKKEGKDSVSNIIKNTISFDLNIPLDGKTKLYQYDVALFSKYVFVFDDGAKIHMANHNFKDKKNKDEYITVKRSSLKNNFN